MTNSFKIAIKHNKKWFFCMLIISFILLSVNSREVHAETQNITLYQYHEDSEGLYDSGWLGENYCVLYPNDNNMNYKKFMKYTYKISDDSIIGLRENGDPDSQAILYPAADGNWYNLMPYNVEVHALGPGTATLSVYDGKKLIGKYKFTVVADREYSPSSFVNNTGDAVGSSISYTDKKQTSITKAELEKEINLIKKFAKAAADSKNTTSNQRILAALKSVVNYGCKQITEANYKELSYKAWKKGITYEGKYRSVYSVLLDKKSVSEGFALLNNAILNNLGFNCSIKKGNGEKAFGCETWNMVELYAQRKIVEQLVDEDALLEGEEEYTEQYYDELYYVAFGAAGALKSDFDFTSTDLESIYKSTHLPAWLIGEDTSQQVISVGQTKELSAGSLNDNIYSSDTSVVTAQNGKITGVKPGVAIVYRYNDTYCDMFYVLVKQKGSAKTIQGKIYTKNSKSFFTSADYAPYISDGQFEESRIENWEALRPFELEPIFGNGGKLKTKYAKGEINIYLEHDGNTETYYTID